MLWKAPGGKLFAKKREFYGIIEFCHLPKYVADLLFLLAPFSTFCALLYSVVCCHIGCGCRIGCGCHIVAELMPHLSGGHKLYGKLQAAVFEVLASTPLPPPAKKMASMEIIDNHSAMLRDSV